MENFRPAQPMKIECFPLLRMNYASLGVGPNLSPFNTKNFIAFSKLTVYFICNVLYSCFEAKTFIEYTQSIYMSSSTALATSALAIAILSVKKLFQVISDCEILANTSKSVACVDSHTESSFLKLENVVRSTKIFGIETNFCRNSSIWAKIEWNSIFCHG